jgi:DNA-binding IclR family transcriptional regulator
MEKLVNEKGGERRRGIQSVEIGLNVLQALSGLGGPSTLTAISQASNMAPPQAHRYLQSLIASGMALQDASTGRYDLGPAALKLGLASLARTDAFRLVDRFVSEFVLNHGETVQIAALGPLGPTIVRWYAGKPGVTTSLTVGSVLSLLHSATGRVFMCFAPPTETDSLAAKELKRAPIKKQDLRVILDEVRLQRRASVSGSVIPGLNAVAFPIFNLQGLVILTATLLWPAERPDPARMASIGALAQVCREVSLQLGWTDVVTS